MERRIPCYSGVLILYWALVVSNRCVAFQSFTRPGWITSTRCYSNTLRVSATATTTAPARTPNMTGYDGAGGFEILSPTTHQQHAFADPSQIEFVAAKDVKRDDNELLFECNPDDPGSCDDVFPFVTMLRGSAPYIASHRDQIAVFHIPGECLETKHFDKLMDDIALSWLLGLKIVIVVGCRYDVECCSQGFANGPECFNSLRVTDDKLLRDIEEEAGYVRFEVERKLNRCLRLQGGLSPSNERNPTPHGNVLGGNFYSAKPFGTVGGTDFQNTGYPSHVHVEKIQHALDNNDVVLLTTVGTSRLGACINVNGNHLAASVAAALNASKLVFFSNQGAVLRKKFDESKTLQDVPVSFVKDFLDYHQVQVHRAGFANFEVASRQLDPSAVEMLLHLGWSSWALEQGVKRAHIVNPGNGALLEELYTARHGVNTCIFRDDEQDELEDDGIDDDLKEIIDAMLPADRDQILFSELPAISQDQ